MAYSYLMGNAGSSTKLAYVYVVEASRQNYPVINDMSLKSFKLTNLNDGYMVNVVNKYQPNDEIIVNMDAKKIIVNGQEPTLITSQVQISFQYLQVKVKK